MRLLAAALSRIQSSASAPHFKALRAGSRAIEFSCAMGARASNNRAHRRVEDVRSVRAASEQEETCFGYLSQ